MLETLGNFGQNLKHFFRAAHMPESYSSMTAVVETKRELFKYFSTRATQLTAGDDENMQFKA